MRRFKSLLWLFFLATFAFISACKNLDNLPEDVDLPEILKIYPADGAINAPVDVAISVTFKNKVGDSSIVPSASGNGCFGTIQMSADDFEGCVEMGVITSDDNKTFRAKPVSKLDLDRKYKIKIVTLVKGSDSDDIIHTHYITPDGFSTLRGGGPPVPGNSGNISVGDLSGDYASLNWTTAYDSSDHTSDLEYKVVRSDKDNISIVSQAETNGETVADWTKNITTSNRIDLISSVKYYFNVLVKDADGNKAAYKRIFLQTPDNVPPVPGNSGDISADDIGLDSLTLSWTTAADNSDDASDLEYKVVKSASDNIGSVNEAEINGDILTDWTRDISSLQISDLTSSTVYYFNALVKDGSGNKAAYNAKSVTTLDIDPPVPGNGDPSLDVSDVADFSLTLSWSAASDEIDNSSDLQYKVVLADDSSRIDTIAEANGDDPDVVTVCGWEAGKTSCAAAGLISASTYYFNVLVKDRSGNINIYAVFSVTTTDGIPPVPGNGGQITIVDISGDSVKFQWTAASDNSDDFSDLLYQAVKSDALDALDATSEALALALPGAWSSETSADIDGLVSAQTYYINVLVRDGTGNPAAYGVFSVVTLDNVPPVPGDPKTVAIDSLEANSISLSWPEASDNSHDSLIRYQVVESTNDNISDMTGIENNGVPITGWISVANADIDGLISAETYYFNVVARDGSGNKEIYDSTSAVTPDNVAPVPGDEGLITVNDLSDDSLKLIWAAASDNSDDASDLLYQVVKSEMPGVVDSTSGALGLALPGAWSSEISADIGDLTIDTVYYFNVLVKDSSDKKAIYDATSAVPMDTIAPVPDSLVISYSDLSSDSVTLTWAKASDNWDGASKLLYKLVKAGSADAIDEASEILSAGAVIMDLTADVTSATAVGLSPDTTYYFNALVQDEEGNAAVYQALPVETHDLIPPSAGFLSVTNLAGTSLTLSWPEAADTMDQASTLLYKVVRSAVNIDGTADAENNGTVTHDWDAGYTFENITDLTPDTLYYFNVLVKNSRQLISGYGGVSATTSKAAWLDDEFGDDGMVIHHSAAGGNGDDLVQAGTSYSGGGMFFTGKSLKADGSHSMVVWRYNADGDLEPGFDFDGLAMDDSADGLAVTIDNQGRILIAGLIQNGGHTDLAIWRYLPDGSLDETFDGDSGGGNGRVTYDEDGENDAFQTITVDSQDRILAAGYVTSGGDKELAIFRFLDDGSLDASFDGDGHNTYNAGNNDDQASAMILDHKERPIIVGYSHNGSDKDLLVLRYTSDGGLDVSFSGDGAATWDNDELSGDDNEGYSLKIDARGKIVVVGRDWNGSDYDMALWRYLPNGAPDSSFDSDGYAAHNNAAGGNSHEAGYSLAFDNQGLILVAGSGYNIDNNLDMVVWRYNLNGAPDNVFNIPNGYFTNDFGSGKDDEASSVFVDGDGGIMASGYVVNSSGDKDLAVWRLTAPPNPGDSLTPIPGNGGLLTVSDSSLYSLTLNWTPAADNSTGAAALEYKVVRSDSDNISTVAEAGLYASDVVMDWTTIVDASAAVSGLTPDSIYYFNVLVRDASGNEAAYNMKSASTLPLSSSEVTIRLYTRFIELNFSEGMDLDSVTLAGSDCVGSVQISTTPAFSTCESITGTKNAFDGNARIVITPATPLSAATYYVKLTSDIKDAGGLFRSEYRNTLTARAYGADWQQATGAAWDDLGRHDHGVVVFKDKVWILGGWASAVKNDVWNSKDGINWTKVKDNNAEGWSARHMHGSVVFQNKIWLMGGADVSYRNDVWNSEDGINWTKVKDHNAEGWSARRVQRPLVFDDKMWIFGGYNGGVLGDIWDSTDGANWNPVTPTGETWSARDWIQPVIFKDKIWILGGQNGSGNLSDVYNSIDGVNWQKVTDSVAWGPRAAHKVAVFDDRLWVTGGYGATFMNDVWYSDDGENWKSAGAAPWTIRDRHVALNFNNKLWIMGGQSNKNDVWYLDESWTQATASAQKSDGSPAWSGRCGHVSLVYDDKIWVMGGDDANAGYLNDVWSSENGDMWTEVTSDAKWSDRVLHSGVVFDDKMWVMGGYDGTSMKDVWHSEDGANWTKAGDAPWAARDSHMSVVHDGKMWVIGGADPWTCDVWDSTDGVNWTEKVNASSCEWIKRNSFGPAVFGDKMWITGGYTSAGGISMNDIYYSDNGANWPQVTPAGSYWSARSMHTAYVFNDKLWVIGGDRQTGGQINDVWYSEDGENWSKHAGSAPWTARYRHSGVVFRDKVWVIGGYNGTYYNDVWYMPGGKAETEAPVPGDGGVLSPYPGSFSIDLSWAAASDNSDDASELMYKIVYSVGDDIDTPAEAAINGSVGMDWTYSTSGSISGLNSQNLYYFNVITRDSQGNMAAYTAGSASTLALSSAEIDSVNFYTKFIEITFSEEMDPASIITSLDCLSGSLKVYTAGDVCVGVSGVHTADNKTFILTPSSDLTSGDNYKITLTSGAEDSDGASLTADEYNSDVLTALVRGDTWVEANNAVWSSGSRYDVNSVVFNNKIWALGGSATGVPNKRNEVWYSEDGAIWNQTTDAAWNARQSHASVVFNDRIWILGGDTDTSLDNDVWYYDQTSDFWTPASYAPWSARRDHSAVVFGNKIWVTGGYDGSNTTSDVWWSEDGENWTNAAHDAGWPARRLHSAVVFNNKIWVIGGDATGDDAISSGILGDVWYSEDGQNWTMAANSPPWLKKRGQCSIAFDGALWMTGGYDGGYGKDVWRTRDGVNWIELSADAWPLKHRSRHGCVDFQNKLWILGGKASSTSRRNDVWYLDETWTQATAAAKQSDGSPAWDIRRSHSSVAFDNKMWIIGGESLKNDVYSSENGVHWELATTSAFSTGGRWFHTTEAFKNKMWTLGGENSSGVTDEVWSSSNGMAWTLEIGANMPARYLHSSAIFNGYMWILGGHNGSERRNDVLRSADGITWEEVLPHNHADSSRWGERQGHEALVYDNKLWVLGGFFHDGVSNIYKNDVWWSDDGANWTKAAEPAWEETREWFASAVFDDKMWIMGGQNGGRLNNVYYSENGSDWIKYNASAPWTARSYFEGLAFDDRLWIMGGYAPPNMNDVWRMESLKTEKIPPTPGGSGVLSVDDVNYDSVNLSWNKASDNSDDVSELRYKIVVSESDNISTIEEALTNGTSDMSWTQDIGSGVISGLSSSTLYYFNVIVKDTQGNMAVYNRDTVTTAVNDIVHNTDRPGSDSIWYGSASVEACRDDCLADSGCVAWVYAYSGTCYLKHTVPAQIPNTCCASGIKE